MDLELFAFVVHLIGFALGLGGATLSDVFFFKILRSSKFTRQDFANLSTLSLVIWVGLGLLILSGLTMFVLIYAEQGSLQLLASPKWQAKLTLVGIVLINGLVFKLSVLPFLRSISEQVGAIQSLGSKISQLAVTGAISFVSWYGILIVSTLPREFRPPYWEFMVVWLVLVILGFFIARVLLAKTVRT